MFRRLESQLLKAGRTVVAAARDGAAVEAALTAEEVGLQSGYQKGEEHMMCICIRDGYMWIRHGYMWYC